MWRGVRNIPGVSGRELMHFTDQPLTLLTVRRQGIYRFHRCTTGIFRHLRKLYWNKKERARGAASSNVSAEEPAREGKCGNLLNSVEPYRRVAERRKIKNHLLLFVSSWIVTDPPPEPPTHTQPFEQIPH